ncbi:MAG: hypothetical protein ACM3SS_07115 [Rhodospirillaceae bacterium]
MKRTLLFAAVLLAMFAVACGQKDEVTPHTQPAAPGASPQPKPLTGEPQAPPGGGTPVYSGKAPATPGGAPAPGEGTTPEKAAGSTSSKEAAAPKRP